MTKIEKNAEIVYLEEFDHLRLRPHIFVGNVEASEEVIPIINGGKLALESHNVSVGMMKIFEEVLDNAMDEARRCFARRKPMKSITVELNLDKNSISVKDTGKGFHKGTEKNKKTGLTNIDTAISRLRAGSNFSNQETTDTLIGMNGVGVSCTNMLSSVFSIETLNSTKFYSRTWLRYIPQEAVIKTNNKDITGTTITFIPDPEVFGEERYKSEVIYAFLVLKSLAMQSDNALKNTKLKFIIDSKPIHLSLDIFPPNTIHTSTKSGSVWFFMNDTPIDLSLINGSCCTGIHQKIIEDKINNAFNTEKAHNIYSVLSIFSFPTNLLKFKDQNKTRFEGKRPNIEPQIETVLTPTFIRSLKKSEFAEELKERLKSLQEISSKKDLLKAKKSKLKVVSKKYFPISGRIHENLFLVEGSSAGGSLLQERDPKKDAIYQLRGKVKNVQTIRDITSNDELVELTSVANLHVEDKGSSCQFDRIIIAADADPDGMHIASLIIHLMWKFFPEVIKQNRLYILKLPLLYALLKSSKTRKYFFSHEEFMKYQETNVDKVQSIKYLKGLGSNDRSDWKYIFSNIQLESIQEDDLAYEMLDVAFGDDPQKRKDWLNKY